eukprot:2514642-Rhodomonas_salina.3
MDPTPSILSQTTLWDDSYDERDAGRERGGGGEDGVGVNRAVSPHELHYALTLGQKLLAQPNPRAEQAAHVVPEVDHVPVVVEA